MVKCFDIHGILKCRFEWEKYGAFTEDLDQKINYFQVDKVYSPDIDVRIGDFNPDLDGCKICDEGIYVKDNFIFCKGANPKVKWVIQVNGLFDGRTIVNVKAKLISLRGFLAPNLLMWSLLIPLLELKFFERGYMLLHSAAVSRDGNAYLLSGRGGAFKTSVVMDLVRSYSYEYMSDERSLVTFGRVLSFPTHIRIFEFCLNNLKSENMNVIAKLRLLHNLIKSQQPEIKVKNEGELSGLLFLNPSTKEFKVENLDSELAARKMLSNQVMENFEALKIVNIDVSPLFKCFNAYSAVYPNSPLANFERRLFLKVKRVLSDIPIYNVYIPLEYSKDVAEFVAKLLQRL